MVVVVEVHGGGGRGGSGAFFLHQLLEIKLNRKHFQ